VKRESKSEKYEIIHLDDSFVAINKPAGLAVLPGRGRKTSLLTLLKEDPKLAGKIPHIVHRIDADTSGVILLALSAEAHKSLSTQFRERTVEKEYLALVRGTPLNESGSVDLPIGTDPHNPKRMVIRGIEPKKSRTKWIVESRFGGVTLLKVFPITGRRHQIRVHLKAMGFPLAVDPLYGGEDIKLSEFKRHYKLGKFQEERPLIDRLTLHARAITIAHPIGGEQVRIEAELPKDFRSTLTALEKWAKR
jgi:23S rRNA pseudouridine955/2504/2580 synthase/23S rRNA pseudouridine1911/1915/1917 synthase